MPAVEPTTRLRLVDGRSIDLWVDDHPSARGLVPVVHHHGTPSSGTPFEPFLEAGRAAGVRYVGWSRAGYGSSTRKPGRSAADAAADMVAVLDHLGVERAYVTGHSGGGPHALACAALIPQRVLGTALIAGVAPWRADGLDFLDGMGAENHDEFGAALQGEQAIRAYLEPQRDVILGLDGPDVAAMFGDLVDEVDRGALTGDYADYMAANMREAVRGSVDGWLDDDIAFTRPWGFDLAAISGPVHVWQGGHDRMVPFAHGEWLAAHLPNACVHLHSHHGHLSIVAGSLRQILESLVQGT